MFNIQNAHRPRDEFDIDVDLETYRGKVLALYDAVDAIRATRRGRILWVVARMVAKVRSLRTT